MTEPRTGTEARDMLRAAMLGMKFTDESGHHDVTAITERLTDELVRMGWDLQLAPRDGTPYARATRAIERLEQRLAEARLSHERVRLEAKIDGARLILSLMEKDR